VSLRSRAGAWLQRSDPTITLDEWANYFNYMGLNYPFVPTMGAANEKVEEPAASFEGYVRAAYKSNGVVFACMLARMCLISEARFQFRQIRNGRPGDLFGTPDLTPLEKPWPNGTTGDLLTRMIQDADAAGNFYAALRFISGRQQIRRMRPDWVTIVLGSDQPPGTAVADLDAEVLGYIYHAGGRNSGTEPLPLLTEEVAHFAPIPDPAARFRGMSWLTPIIREVMGDQAMTNHKLKFFENDAAQPLDAKLVTPSGWKRMGDIEVGDRVVGPDAKPRRVLGVYPQGEKDIYRVTFSSGASTECCGDHFWNVASIYDRKLGRERVMKLSDIVEQGIHYPSGPAKWSVPLAEPVEYDDAGPLPLDPYLLGVMLGDGCFRGGCLSFSTADTEIVESVAALVPAGVTVHAGHEYHYRLVAGRPHPMIRSAKDLGLWDVIGYEKSIPEPYMRGRVGDRVALLQGLIDTDGHVVPEPLTGVMFSSTSEDLALQVCELARSLGGIATIKRATSRPKEPKRRQQWLVRINRLPDWIIPARLTRKVEHYRSTIRGGTHRHQYIQKVEPVGRTDVQCIRVDAADGLYLTDDFIVTHNTIRQAVILDASIRGDAFDKWVAKFEAKHKGIDKAYGTLFLGAGASIIPVGANLEQAAFKELQGSGETRIAADSGIHPVILGLSEGLQGSSLNAGNFQAARRLTADKTLRPLWRNAAGSLASIINVPSGAELWYDDRDIPFLQDDVRDAAELQQKQAFSMKALVEAGYTPDSVVDAVVSGDMRRLVHSGMTSKQLQAPAPADGSAPAGLNGSGDPAQAALPPAPQ
jgi:hypothetical protein